MKKFLDAVGLSLALLMPAQIALTATNEEKVMSKLDEVEKEVKSLREMLTARMASGKKMSAASMNEAMKMMDSFMTDMKRFRKNRQSE